MSRLPTFTVRLFMTTGLSRKGCVEFIKWLKSYTCDGHYTPLTPLVKWRFQWAISVRFDTAPKKHLVLNHAVGITELLTAKATFEPLHGYHATADHVAGGRKLVVICNSISALLATGVLNQTVEMW